MDTELFELCKEVYKRFPDWNSKTLKAYMEDHYVGEHNKGIDIFNDPKETTYFKFVAPLYTSDYLLEKLPDYPIGIGKSDENYYSQIVVKRIATKYEAYYLNYVTQLHFGHSLADTPLKALLRLTIALDDAGELK